MITLDTLMRQAPVIPVLVIDEIAQAAPIAEALVAGGLTVLEVTLRTPAALEVIAEMSRVSGAIVGAGTVRNPAQMDQALTAGARFIVSPGLTAPLAEAAVSAHTPYLPGVSTASDIMRGLDHGLERFKFFPAEPSGGAPLLKALAAPFREVRFCPTGGITAASLASWLSMPEVLCVGGSWLVAKGPPDPAAIQAAAAHAVALAGQAGWRAD